MTARTGNYKSNCNGKSKSWLGKCSIPTHRKIAMDGAPVCSWRIDVEKHKRTGGGGDFFLAVRAMDSV
jgi:hypothetical protein